MIAKKSAAHNTRIGAPGPPFATQPLLRRQSTNSMVPRWARRYKTGGAFGMLEGGITNGKQFVIANAAEL
jgi:hypothetical protein